MAATAGGGRESRHFFKREDDDAMKEIWIMELKGSETVDGVFSSFESAAKWLSTKDDELYSMSVYDITGDEPKEITGQYDMMNLESRAREIRILAE